MFPWGSHPFPTSPRWPPHRRIHHPLDHMLRQWTPVVGSQLTHQGPGCPLRQPLNHNPHLPKLCQLLVGRPARPSSVLHFAHRLLQTRKGHPAQLLVSQPSPLQQHHIPFRNPPARPLDRLHRQPHPQHHILDHSHLGCGHTQLAGPFLPQPLSPLLSGLPSLFPLLGLLLAFSLPPPSLFQGFLSIRLTRFHQFLRFSNHFLWIITGKQVDQANQIVLRARPNKVHQHAIWLGTRRNRRPSFFWSLQSPKASVFVLPLNHVRQHSCNPTNRCLGKQGPRLGWTCPQTSLKPRRIKSFRKHPAIHQELKITCIKPLENLLPLFMVVVHVLMQQIRINPLVTPHYAICITLLPAV